MHAAVQPLLMKFVLSPAKVNMSVLKMLGVVSLQRISKGFTLVPAIPQKACDGDSAGGTSKFHEKPIQ